MAHSTQLLGERKLFRCPVCRRDVAAKLFGRLSLNDMPMAEGDSVIDAAVATLNMASANVQVTNVVIDHNCTRQNVRGTSGGIVEQA